MIAKDIAHLDVPSVSVPNDCVPNGKSRKENKHDRSKQNIALTGAEKNTHNMGLYKRGTTWCVQYFADGRRIREAVGPSKRQAELILAQRKTELKEARLQKQFSTRYDALPAADIDTRGLGACVYFVQS